MKRIYVSYRREDTSESYGRIVERLRSYFGSEATLRTDTAYTADGAVIPPNEYRTYVADAMKRCAVLLLLVGPHWVESGKPDGWRLSDFNDPVRIEIEAALRAGIPIVPALVQQGSMPHADELPASLQLLLEQDQEHKGKRGRESLLSLVSRAGLQVRRDPDFGGDAQRLCEVIENLAGLEAASLERASGAINRTLRYVTLAASAALFIHAGVLAYFALNFVVPLTPAFAIPVKWLPTIIITSLVDWGIYFLAGYVTGRRTGDVGLGISAAVTSYIIGLVVGIAVFADITWSKWELLSVPVPTPAILVGSPDWLLSPLLLLMRPFLLLFSVLVLGIPFGLIASFALGSLGGILGTRVTEFVSARQRSRERESLIQSETDEKEAVQQRRAVTTIFRRRVRSGQVIRRGATPAGKVFISYRRDDSAVMCGSIYDRLAEIFGVDTVFKDVDMIPVGTNFEKFISSTLEQCVAQVVVIGPRWVSIALPDGQRRLDDPRDFVRLEVESALRLGIHVIPVLVQGAQLPTADELPESLRPLADLTPITVRYAPDFDSDMRNLGLILAPTVWPAPTRQPLLKRVTSLQAGPRATQTAALIWLGLFLILGIIFGVQIARGLGLQSGATTSSLVTFLGAAPIVMTLLSVISGAQLGYITGQVRRSFWLAWRAVLMGSAALVITTQIHGATLYGSTVLAVQDSTYRAFTTGTLVAAAVVALGPALVAALLGAAIASFFRHRRKSSGLSSLFTRAPRTLQVLYANDDATAGAHITRGLTSFFGRRVLPSKRQSLQPGLADHVGQTLPANFVQRTLQRSSAVLVLVGPDWQAGGDTATEMDNPENPLRQRIEAALALGRPIIPVLLTGAMMPSPNQLPASMHEFAMLNAAWVRNEPDYSGDMRRLTRVIERLTGLHKAESATDTWIPLLLGVVLSGLALLGVDAFMARLVLAAFSQLSQATAILAGAVVVLVDLVIYGLTSGFVTRWSGKRQNGVLAAMLGASLAMLASVEGFRLAQAQWSAGVDKLTGSHILTTQALGAIAVYIVIRIPFQSLGALAASTIGAFYGRIAFRGRERRQQERRLYAMARVATQSEPLAEMSARSTHVTHSVVTEVAPETAALAANTLDGITESAHEATLVSSPVISTTVNDGEVANSSAQQEVAQLDGAEGEESRREALLADMRAAYLRTQARRRKRLGIVLGLVAAVLLIALLSTGLVYRSQVGGIAANATAIANATATYVTSPSFSFSAPEFGPNCGPKTDGAIWQLRSTDPNPNVLTMTCDSDFTSLVNLAPYPEMMTLTLAYPYASTYQLQLDINSFLDVGQCAGLVSSGRNGTPGSAIEYVLCDDGSWSVSTVNGDGSQVRRLASGYVSFLPAFNHLTVNVYMYEEQFTINDQVVKTIVSDQQNNTTDYIGACLNWGPTASGSIGAELSDFSYQPIAPNPPATPSPTPKKSR
jgi:hypothetical protein